MQKHGGTAAWHGYLAWTVSRQEYKEEGTGVN